MMGFVHGAVGAASGLGLLHTLRLKHPPTRFSRAVHFGSAFTLGLLLHTLFDVIPHNYFLPVWGDFLLGCVTLLTAWWCSRGAERFLVLTVMAGSVLPDVEYLFLPDWLGGVLGVHHFVAHFPVHRGWHPPHLPTNHLGAILFQSLLAWDGLLILVVLRFRRRPSA